MKHKEKILQLRSEGKSYGQIQEILGCSRGTISYHLGKGQKEKTFNRQKDNRATIDNYIREYKESKPCSDCNIYFPYYVMDFDHVDGKSFNISRHRHHTKMLETVKKEIQKCELVCSNCHRVRTHNRKTRSVSSVG